MLTKTFKILQTLCAVYGWEVVNNHGLSSKSVDNPVTQASLPAERFLDWNILVTPRRCINWSPKLTPFQREMVGDSPPYNVRRVGKKHNAVRQAVTLVLGQMHEQIQWGSLKAWLAFACWAPWHHDLCHGRDSSCWLPAGLVFVFIHLVFVFWLGHSTHLCLRW